MFNPLAVECLRTAFKWTPVVGYSAQIFPEKTEKGTDIERIWTL